MSGPPISICTYACTNMFFISSLMCTRVCVCVRARKTLFYARIQVLFFSQLISMDFLLIYFLRFPYIFILIRFI